MQYIGLITSMDNIVMLLALVKIALIEFMFNIYCLCPCYYNISCMCAVYIQWLLNFDELCTGYWYTGHPSDIHDWLFIYNIYTNGGCISIQTYITIIGTFTNILTFRQISGHPRVQTPNFEHLDTYFQVMRYCPYTYFYISRHISWQYPDNYVWLSKHSAMLPICRYLFWGIYTPSFRNPDNVQNFIFGHQNRILNTLTVSRHLF